MMYHLFGIETKAFTQMSGAEQKGVVDEVSRMHTSIEAVNIGCLYRS